MANTSIKSAFEQFWRNVITKINSSVTQVTEYTDSKLAEQVGTSSVATQLNSHNSSSSSHSDIRDLITDLSANVDSHTHNASQISAGTFAGQVVANASGQSSSSYVVRNTKISATAESPTVAGQICWKRA